MTAGFLDPAAPAAATTPEVAAPVAADPAVATFLDAMSPLGSGAPAAAPGVVGEAALTPGAIAQNANGKYPACIGTYGKMKGFKPCGVQLMENGTIVLGEFFGGFDGYFSTDPADGHESCFNQAVAEVLGVPICETTPGTNKTVTVRTLLSKHNQKQSEKNENLHVVPKVLPLLFFRLFLVSSRKVESF